MPFRLGLIPNLAKYSFLGLQRNFNRVNIKSTVSSTRCTYVALVVAGAVGPKGKLVRAGAIVAYFKFCIEARARHLGASRQRLEGLNNG